MDDEASDRVPGDHYRRQADQARRLADDATTPAVKEHLRDLAARFERLAEVRRYERFSERNRLLTYPQPSRSIPAAAAIPPSTRT